MLNEGHIDNTRKVTIDVTINIQKHFSDANLLESNQQIVLFTREARSKMDRLWIMWT